LADESEVLFTQAVRSRAAIEDTKRLLKGVCHGVEPQEACCSAERMEAPPELVPGGPRGGVVFEQREKLASIVYFATQRSNELGAGAADSAALGVFGVGCTVSLEHAHFPKLVRTLASLEHAD
jgi:hypothetical protein